MKIRHILLIVLCSLTAPVTAQQGQRGAPPGTIRVRVRLIPVDVIVTDRFDRPVTDLKQEDFLLFENGRRQEIRHFSIEKLEPASLPPAPSPATKMRAIPAAELAPRESRTFLIVMGRGRHQTPLRAVDSLIRFVRDGLLPQDRVAVFAYNRATDFTTDHAKVAAVLERYKKGHEKIESWLESRMRGLAAVYGSQEIPKSFQSEIDGIFAGPEGVGSRGLTPAGAGDMAGTARDLQKALTEEIRDPEAAKVSPFDALEAGMIADLSFDEFASLSSATSQDMRNLFSCIEYMRYMDGDKHLLFFTAGGLFFPRGRAEQDQGLAAVANDARVALDTFQTGGVYVPPPFQSARLGRTPAPVLPQAQWSRTFALQSMRSISQLTGGRASVYEDIGKALSRVNELTRVQYLLGYYPADDRWNGEYRSINVRVNRPGLRVSFRHGYYARDTLRPYDRTEFFAYSRISAAAYHEGNLDDLPFRAGTEVITAEDGKPQIRVNLEIDPAGIRFSKEGDRHVAGLRVVVFWANGRGDFLGEEWKNLDFRLLEETYRYYIGVHIPFSLTVPRVVPDQVLKVVVYDKGGDRVGSKLVKVRD
jgi:VWFA-related protein